MKTNDMDAFLESIGVAIKVRMDLSLYDGDYNCACGKSHHYGYHVNLLCQGKWRVVMECPENPDYLTCVKIKMFMMVKFKGFESLSGYHIQSDKDRVLLHSAFNSLR
jgi:hypothetical protein